MTEPSDVRNESNPEEEILKESKETDWTEDTLEYAEQEDFDVGDLECVDEENGEKRNDDRRRIKEAEQSVQRHANRLEGRYNPYKIPYSYMDRRDSPKKSRNAKHSPARIARDKKRRKEYYERKKAQRGEGGIDLDELEEVDSCEFDEGTPSDSVSTPCLSESSSSSPAPDNDEDDPWTQNISGVDSIPLLDDEDFPSLCEEIDPDILKKAAHSQNTTEQMGITPPTTMENDEKNKIEENSGPSKQLNNHNLSSKRSRSPITRRKQSPPTKKSHLTRRRSRSIDTSPWRTWDKQKETRRRRESGSRDRVDRGRHHPTVDRKTTETRIHRRDKSTEHGRRGEEQALNHKESTRNKSTQGRKEQKSTSPKTSRQDNRRPRPPTSREIRDYVNELDSRKSRKPTEPERRKTSDSRRSTRSDHERLPVRRA